MLKIVFFVLFLGVVLPYNLLLMFGFTGSEILEFIFYLWILMIGVFVLFKFKNKNYDIPGERVYREELDDDTKLL